MMEHNIGIAMLKPHGQTFAETKDDVLCFSSAKEQPFNLCKNIRNYYVEAPNRYHLPLQIDMTVRIDSPALYIILGKGEIAFGNRTSHIEDICGPHKDKNIHFNSHITMNEFVRIKICFNLKEMQILVNGEERYYSTSEKYMRAKNFASMNQEGFSLKIACDNRVDSQIKQIIITEGIAEINREQVLDNEPFKFYALTGKPTFESCIAELPDTLRSAVIDIDAWIRTLRPIKFKRQIDKNGEKITYIASDEGFSYQVYISGGVLQHKLWWYLLTQGKPETWHRKADNMENTLNYLAQTDSFFAQRMFNNLYKCSGGYTSGCLGRTPYTFNDKKIISCHGKLNFNMNLSEFDDVKRFIGAVNDITGKGE
jgi:hypothetical protein